MDFWHRLYGYLNGCCIFHFSQTSEFRVNISIVNIFEWMYSFFVVVNIVKDISYTFRLADFKSCGSDNLLATVHVHTNIYYTTYCMLFSLVLFPIICFKVFFHKMLLLVALRICSWYQDSPARCAGIFQHDFIYMAIGLGSFI